jgi:hypothetical protein
MGSHNSKSYNDTPRSNSNYPILYNSNDQQLYQKYSFNNQVDNLEGQNLNQNLESHREYLPSEVKIQNEKEDSDYEYFPNNYKFADKDDQVEFRTVPDEEYSDINSTSPSQDEVYLNQVKKIHIKEHYFKASPREDYDKLKREEWHKFYYKVPPKKSPKAIKKFGFENRKETLATKKTTYIHHFPDELNPQKFISPPMIYQFDDDPYDNTFN